MRYFISAGEPSGDTHAAELIKEILRADPDARISFLGGDLMAQAAGCPPVIHYRHMAFMGFSEVLRHLPEIFSNFSTAQKAIKQQMPDAIILVDYPGFNLKLAKFAHKLRIPVYYYISPKVWAWKSWRVKAMKRYLKAIFSILPFEKEWFSRRGIEVHYVGNPSVEEIDGRITLAPAAGDFLNKFAIEASRPILALVPGSRRGEIRCNLPIMVEVARRTPGLTPVIAGAPGINSDIYTDIAPDIKVVSNATTPLMLHAHAALVTSGTATLEAALCGVPQIACYRANGSRLSYSIMKRLIKSPFVTLPNLIAGRQIIPELLVHRCTVDAVDRELKAIIADSDERRAQIEGYRLVRERLGKSSAAITAASILTNTLQNASK